MDADTSGLLVLTNDGDLAHVLAHPSFGVTKTYLAEVAGPVARDVGRRLREGIEPAFAARTLVSVLLSLSVRENAVRAQQSNGEGDPIRDLQCLIRTFLA